MVWRIILVFVLSFGLSAPLFAQSFRAVATADPARSIIEDQGPGFRIELHMSQGVPFRLAYQTAPNRLHFIFDGLDFRDMRESAFLNANRVTGVTFDNRVARQTVLTLLLAAPAIPLDLSLDISPEDGRAVLSGYFELAEASEFERRAQTSVLPQFPNLSTVEVVGDATDADQEFVVVLDPGHGGRDPGAEFGGLNEADLMLSFARRLREDLLRAGADRVVLTRNSDEFVSLPRRLTHAHQAAGDVFLSLHADALEGGGARGVTVYVLSTSSSDKASAALVERHERNDLVGGVDLEGEEDTVVQALIGLARTETTPRSKALQSSLISSLQRDLPYINSNPRRHAAFSVLKAPDIPSVLIELGFLSDERDAANLVNPAWADRASRGVAEAVMGWWADDQSLAPGLRQ
ncbi:MAG: N-acetylmuramoyl-L-alanine amidase [Pseudomonadota bacterium]